ncbi:MAG TPA: ATP-binding cassette domain-containing protein [Bryobacteraceae bacterium]|nr:ATP-binding cassette domain-containing protein [Bryobacteraceae bacterium]
MEPDTQSAEKNGTTEAPVVVQGLHKSFGTQKVLHGVDLIADQGETVAVLGRSGTGKSVLLKLLIGLEQPDSGTIRIRGQEITALERKQLNQVRVKIGFLFQQGALYDSLTVGENVEFPLRRHTRLSEADRREKALELLSQVGMKQDAAKMPSEISGGMQKRVGLARSLALDPEILLLDEPTAGLDPITASEIGKLILSLQEKRKTTCIVVTHDIHGAKAFCDRMVFLQEGRVSLDGTFEQLKKSRDSFVIEFLRDAA